MRLYHCLLLTILCVVVIVFIAGCTARNDSEIGSCNSTSNDSNKIRGNSSSNDPDNGGGNFTQPAELVWQNTLSKSRYFNSNAVIRTNDGGYAIAGTTSMRFQRGINFSNYMDRMVLAKTDPGGNELWNNTYGDGYSYGTALVQASDNGYLVIGRKRIGPDDYRAYIIKTDSMGGEVWNRSYNWGIYDGGNSIVKTNDGGYAITGSMFDDLQYPHVLLARLDSDGNVLWQNTYYKGSGRGLIQTADGGYVISINTKIDDANLPIDTFKPQLIKTDAQGNVEWAKVYEPGPDNFNSSFITMTLQTVDGGYIICGSTSPSNIFLIRADSNGNELWTKRYGPFDYYPHEACLAPSNDGSYFVLRCENNPRVFATIPPNPSEWVCAHAYLFKVDTNGNEIWNTSTTYRGDGNYYCISINNYGAEGSNILGVLGIDSSTYGDDFYVVKVA